MSSGVAVGNAGLLPRWAAAATDGSAPPLSVDAAGVDVVATYTPWIFHEEIQGDFVFTGDRDLRRFLSLCQDLGLRVVLRSGPCSHAELRNGGIPDG